MDCEVVVGGWPCQDISVAGTGRGLEGPNSKLFYELLRVAKSSSAEVVVAENVSNVLRLEGGRIFRIILSEFQKSGFPYIAWRSINAREFGLPHHRNRVFLVAAACLNTATSLFRDHKCQAGLTQDDPVAGFYWTAGTHSINYSVGYVPTIKVGSSLSIPSPPAIHFEDTVRLLSPEEALRLQGFTDIKVENFSKSDIYRMAGNAVAAPVGRFVLDGILLGLEAQDFETKSQMSMFIDDVLDEVGPIPKSGIFDGEITEVLLKKNSLAANLSEYIDPRNRAPISARAALGLLSRLDRSKMPCPENLRSVLTRISESKAISVDNVGI